MDDGFTTSKMETHLKLQTTIFSQMMENKAQDSLEFKQHWLVSFWSRPNVIKIGKSQISYEKRSAIQGPKSMFNKHTTHPIATSSMQDKFQWSTVWMMVFTIPVALFMLIFGKRLPVFYGTIIITSDAGGKDVVKFMANYKTVVKEFSKRK